MIRHAFDRYSSWPFLARFWVAFFPLAILLYVLSVLL